MALNVDFVSIIAIKLNVKDHLQAPYKAPKCETATDNLAYLTFNCLKQ